MNLRQNGLDLVCNEYVLDKRGDQTRFPSALVPADTDANLCISATNLNGSICLEVPVAMVLSFQPCKKRLCINWPTYESPRRQIEQEDAVSVISPVHSPS